MTKDAQPRSWHRTALVLAGIFLVDLGYSGQGLFSLFVAFGGLVLLTAGALWAAVRGAGSLARSRGVRASMYLVLGAATVATMQFHLSTAQHHAASVIEACQAYKTRYGILPKTLQQLVPEFLPAVPRAKFTLAWNDFTYSAPSETSHTLMYVALPPFGRRVYHFEQAQWTQFD